jgi:GntR family transcriptional repressor for pyruvate dehydrogenase complex
MAEIFEPIKPKRISDEIVVQLKSLVFQGKLKAGEKLPPERELARSLNVSRVSLREALTTLQGMGLLEIQQGNRTFVRPITTRSTYDPLVSFSKSSPQNVLKLIEVRKYLEMGCTALAAERATDKEIKQLESILKQMEEDFEKNRLGAKSDLDFHNTIAEATHNEAYTHMMKTMYDLLQEELRLAWAGVFRKKGRRKALLEQHRNIVAAIREHDPRRGAKETFRHLSFVEQNWEDTLTGKNNSKVVEKWVR